MDFSKSVIFDKEFRNKLMANPKEHYKEFNNNLLDDVKIVVKKNTKDTIYIVIPSGDIMGNIDKVQAAGDCAGTAGTAGSLSTYGCATTTASSFGSIASVGSASTLGM